MKTTMTASSRIEYTNDGLLITFENGRAYDVHPGRDGDVVCTLVAGTIDLHPFAKAVTTLVDQDIHDEIERCADLYYQKRK
ncbi:MAG TPA: hypothetical protein ENN44_06200 [Methanoculleus sp.]|nr:hypothetical protein [Methanoculleus sp.]